jgi:hypothetical protein
MGRNLKHGNIAEILHCPSSPNPFSQAWEKGCKSTKLSLLHPFLGLGEGKCNRFHPKLIATTTAVLSLLVMPMEAQSAKKQVKLQTIEQLATSVATAYSDGKLDQLAIPVIKKVQIRINHSLGEEQELVQEFKTWQEGEKWLSSKSRDGLPTRESRSLLSCKKGFCNYNFQAGILHNHLYLKKIAYGYKNGRPYIKSIYLLDGD